MSADVIDLAARRAQREAEEDDAAQFGACPECHRSDGYFNYERTHWFFCREHRTMWCIGAGLFSSWQDESWDDWKRNAREFGGYRKVQPWAPPVPADAPAPVPVDCADQPF